MVTMLGRTIVTDAGLVSQFVIRDENGTNAWEYYEDGEITGPVSLQPISDELLRHLGYFDA